MFIFGISSRSTFSDYILNDPGCCMVHLLIIQCYLTLCFDSRFPFDFSSITRLGIPDFQMMKSPTSPTTTPWLLKQTFFILNI